MNMSSCARAMSPIACRPVGRGDEACHVLRWESLAIHVSEGMIGRERFFWKEQAEGAARPLSHTSAPLALICLCEMSIISPAPKDCSLSPALANAGLQACEPRRWATKGGGRRNAARLAKHALATYWRGHTTTTSSTIRIWAERHARDCHTSSIQEGDDRRWGSLVMLV